MIDKLHTKNITLSPKVPMRIGVQTLHTPSARHLLGTSIGSGAVLSADASGPCPNSFRQFTYFSFVSAVLCSSLASRAPDSNPASIRAQVHSHDARPPALNQQRVGGAKDDTFWRRSIFARQMCCVRGCSAMSSRSNSQRSSKTPRG